jgi:hypothetical protein
LWVTASGSCFRRIAGPRIKSGVTIGDGGRLMNEARLKTNGCRDESLPAGGLLLPFPKTTAK